jgi:hypothetical protein
LRSNQYSTYPPKEKINKSTNKIESIKPFHNILKDIQEQRRVFPKGHINNMLYKEIGNGIYGNVCRGISNKMSYDSLTKESLRVGGTLLSYPILGSWTTAFIRSVVVECLHNIQRLNGKVVSVTTDGFVTNLEDLESKLLNLPSDDIVLLTKYRFLRHDLSGVPDALEQKTHGRGIISWTTRGQHGLESNIAAATGLQKKGYEKNELSTLFKKTLKDSTKMFEFTRSSLRSAKDIFIKGGHVTEVLKDQTFRLFYDNRRKIVEPTEFKTSNSHDLSSILLDSEPLTNINQCKTLRFLSKFPITLPYNKTNGNKSSTIYKKK